MVCQSSYFIPISTMALNSSDKVCLLSLNISDLIFCRFQGFLFSSTIIPNDCCIKEASIRYYNTYQYIPIIPDGIKEASVAPKTTAVKPSHTASIASKL